MKYSKVALDPVKKLCYIAQRKTLQTLFLSMEGDVLQFQTYDSREAELNALTKSIKENIENDKLNLSRDILIITLGEGKTLQKAVSEHLMKAGINIYIPGALEKIISSQNGQRKIVINFGKMTLLRFHKSTVLKVTKHMLYT